MRSGHTVNEINSVIATVRRLEAEQVTQYGALASHERTVQEGLGKEHEIAENSFAQIQKGLRKLRTWAESQLQAVNLELPASRETPGEHQSGDAVALLADSKKVSARLSGLVMELERYRMLRNEWLLALAAFNAACDDADNKLSALISDPLKIQKTVQDVTEKAKLVADAAKAFADDPTELDGYKEAMERLRKTTGSADSVMVKLAELEQCRRLTIEWKEACAALNQACAALNQASAKAHTEADTVTDTSALRERVSALEQGEQRLLLAATALAGYPETIEGYPETLEGYPETLEGYQETLDGYQAALTQSWQARVKLQQRVERCLMLQTVRRVSIAAALALSVLIFVLIWRTRLNVNLEFNGMAVAADSMTLLVDSVPFRSGDRVSLFAKSLVIESPKYDPVSVSLADIGVGFGRNNQTPAIRLARSTGRLELKSTPQTATFTLLDSDMKTVSGEGHRIFEKMPTGSYLIAWRQGIWKSGEQAVTVERGKSVTASYAFDASLRIIVEPSDAVVRIDAITVGLSPYFDSNAAPGTVKVSLNKSGYYEETFPLILRSEKITDASRRLEPIYGERVLQATPGVGATSTIPDQTPMWGAQINTVKDAFQHTPIKLDVRRDGLTLTFRIKNIRSSDSIVFGYQEFRDGFFGSEGVHIVDDTGAKFYPKRYWYSNRISGFVPITKYFVAFGSSAAYGGLLRPGQEIDLKIDFPMISSGAEKIEFVSPKVYMMQEAFVWKDITVFRPGYRR